MEVRFRTRQLERCFLEAIQAFRAWGQPVGLRYIHRLQLLMEAEGVDAFRGATALRIHPLSGERANQYAMTLAGRWRLVFTVDGDTVTVEEVSNHYDD